MSEDSDFNLSAKALELDTFKQKSFADLYGYLNTFLLW